MAEVTAEKKLKRFKCINKISQKAIDSGAGDGERKIVNQNQEIEAMDVIYDQKKSQIIFTDGELNGRQPGENVIATLQKIDNWIIKEIA